MYLVRGKADFENRIAGPEPENLKARPPQGAKTGEGQKGASKAGGETPDITNPETFRPRAVRRGGAAVAGEPEQDREWPWRCSQRWRRTNRAAKDGSAGERKVNGRGSSKVEQTIKRLFNKGRFLFA